MKNLITILVLSLSMISSAWASHMVGGSIHYRCLGFGQYELSIVHFRDCSGIPMPATRIINYQSPSCGLNGAFVLPLVSVQEVTPVCSQFAASTTCNGGGFMGVQEYVYMDTVTLPQNCADWLFYHSECCWNNSIVNINVGSGFHTQSSLNDLDYICNSNVVFNGRGIMFANQGQPNVYDPLGSDLDGDGLKYRLTSAMQALGAPVFYNGGYTGQNPINLINSFDTLSGRLSFTPSTIGSFVIAYNVEEYRNGDLIAVTHRVIQIIVGNYGASTPPVPSVNNVTGASSMGDSIFACAGTPLNFDFTFTDPDVGDSIGIIHNIAAQLPGAVYTITGTNPLVLNIQWTPFGSGIYNVGVVVENLGCPVTLNSQVADVTIFVTENSPRLTVDDYYLCATPSINITASSGYLSYLWSTGETTQGITITTAGVYSVTTTGGGCGGNFAAVEIFDSPPIGIGNDTTIYLGDSIPLLVQLSNGLTPGRYVDTSVTVNIPVNGVAVIPLDVNGVFPGIIDTFILEQCFININNAPSTDSLEVYLVAPNTTMIPLARRRGGTTNASYTNSGFDPYATDPIAGYNLANSIIPPDSTFIPEGNWWHFNGSQLNGQWQLAMRQLGGSQAGVATYFGLQFGGGFNYNWTPATGLSCSDCPNPYAAPDTTTTYIVELTNILGCTSYDTITVYVQPRWSIDTIVTEVTQDSNTIICATLPANFGTALSASNINTLNYGTLTATGTIGCFVYDADSLAEVTDTLILVVCNTAGFCDTTVVIMNTISCVWPGDANTDMIANHYDLLPIGLGYGQIGDLRPNATINYQCEPHYNWGIGTPLSNIDYKHSDTDGDGIISYDDTMAIVQNWGMVHLRNDNNPGTSQAPTGGPFLVNYAMATPGSTIRIPIMLGDSSNPVDSAYGLAYTIYYDQTMIDTGSVFVDFDTSWLGTQNMDMITVVKDQYNYGQVHIGMTRIDHTTRSGSGQIGSIQMTIKDDILRRSPILHLLMGIGQIQFIDNMENAVTINPLPSYVLITGRNETGTTAIENHALQVFPNPAQDKVYLQSSTEPILMIKAFNAAGQEIATRNVNNHNVQLDTKDWAEGLYFLQVQTASTLETRKVLVKR